MKPFEAIFKNEVLVMGVMKRENAAKYWAHCDIAKLDFFGKIFIQKFVPNAHIKFSLCPKYS